jgi:hypothetical protein
MQSSSAYIDLRHHQVRTKTPRAAEIFRLMTILNQNGLLRWHMEDMDEASANYIDDKYRYDLSAEFIVDFLNRSCVAPGETDKNRNFNVFSPFK